MTSIKIGMVVPFTGPPALRIGGNLMRSGTVAWINRYNAAGGCRGRQIELLIEDSAYDIEQTARAIRKLHEQHNVVALLNANGTPQLTAALPYLEQNRLPLIFPFAGAEEWFNPPHWGIFSAQAPFNDVGWLLGQWTASADHKRVVVFHPDYPEISPLMARQAHLGYEAAGVESGVIRSLCVPLGCEDGVAMADNLLALEPDAIIVLVNWLELVSAVREIEKRGRQIPLYSWSANVTQQIAGFGGDLIEGMKGYSPLIAGPMSGTPEVIEYREAMARYFPDQQPDVVSMTAFANAKLFTTALDRIVGTVNSAQLVAALETLHRAETGILPPVTFSATRHLGVSEVQPMELTSSVWQPCGPAETLPSTR